MTDKEFELTAMLKEAIKQRDQALMDGLQKSAQLALSGRKIGELEQKITELDKALNARENADGGTNPD